MPCKPTLRSAFGLFSSKPVFEVFVDVSFLRLQFVFATEPTSEMMSRKKVTLTIHEELTKSLTTMLRPANTDFLVINKFLSHASFFFQILIKSMAQHLLNTNRIKVWIFSLNF